MTDPHNNINRLCSVLGVPGFRAWHVDEFVRDSGGNATYWLTNIWTGQRMRANMASLTNLY